jgi:hypothetical protein
MSGLIINPMIMLQKLTQAASLLKQGKNCSKMSLMNWNMERPSSCRPMLCDNSIVTQAAWSFYQFIFLSQELATHKIP